MFGGEGDGEGDFWEWRSQLPIFLQLCPKTQSATQISKFQLSNYSLMSTNFYFIFIFCNKYLSLVFGKEMRAFKEKSNEGSHHEI